MKTKFQETSKTTLRKIIKINKLQKMKVRKHAHKLFIKVQ